MNQELRICQNCKNQFTIEPDDFNFYQKIKVPPPTFCPDCRLQRRLMFRNEHFLYKVKSDFSGKEIFSMHPREGGLKVYENDTWYSDKWNAIDYGREYDFSKPLFFNLMNYFVPHPYLPFQ